MKFVRNCWYGAVWSEALADKPVARRVLDKPLVLFRTGEGVAALDGACPHRFAPLELGKVVGGDRIRCVYHGLEFDRIGACVRNPHNAGRIPPAARLGSYVTAERHGMVWVWLGEKAPDLDAIPDLSILDESDPAQVSKRDWLTVKANYLLVIENLLDLSHANFLHEGILGNEEMADAELTASDDAGDLVVRRLMRDVPVPGLFDLLYKQDGGQVDFWSEIRLTGVSVLINNSWVTDVGEPRQAGAGLIGTHILTPVDETTTLYHFCAVRGNPRASSRIPGPEIQQRLSEMRRMAFAEQDATVMEAQQRALLDPSINTSRPAFFDIDIGAARLNRRIAGQLERDAG